MTYHIDDVVGPDESLQFPSELYQWLEENDAHIEFRETSDDGMKYIITANDAPQYKAQRICELKTLLSKSDYKAIKFAEGELTEEEYAPVREQRRQWRAEINELEDLDSNSEV